MVVLLLEAGDRGDQDSDLEDVLKDDEEAYEPAGELRIVENNSDAEEEPDSLPRKCVGKSKWIKSGTSDKPIKSGEPNLSPNLIDVLDSSALTIGSKIFSRDIVMMLVHQTYLYENRNKTEETFEVDEQEMERFRGILLISGYHILVASWKPLLVSSISKILVYNCLQCNE